MLDPNAGVSGLVAVVAWLAVINLLLLVFNLLPAFPMDGGRVARAIAWWKTGDRTAATRFAANLGRLFGYLFIAGGLFLILTGDLFGGVWLGLIGMVVNGSARGAAMQTAITSRIDNLSVADVMDREPVAIPGDISVEQALDEYFLRYRWPWFPVVDAAHRFLGLLERDRADEVPEVSRASSSVADLIDADQGLFQVGRHAARLAAVESEPAPARRPDGGRRRRPPLRRDHGGAGRAGAQRRHRLVAGVPFGRYAEFRKGTAALRRLRGGGR